MQQNSRVHVEVDGHLENGGRAQMPGSSRLPDSPPVTDVSARSSGSSSSSNYGGSPYLPDSYGYKAESLDGLIMPQTGFDANGMQMQQAAYMHSPYEGQPNQMTYPGIPMGNAQYPQQMNAGVYGNMPGFDARAMGMAEPSRKRVRNDEVQQPFDMSRVKPDPTMLAFPQPPACHSVPPMTPSFVMASSPIGSESYDEPFRAHNGSQQTIRFTKYCEETWHKLYDMHRQELHFHMPVVADKGFSYSGKDGCFVNQKKNHFQVSVNIEAFDGTPPSHVLVGDNFKAIAKMQLAFCGIQSENHSAKIEIKQSTKNRIPEEYNPVELKNIPPRQVTTVTVPRLHFSGTTANNQRKNGKPHPDQKYFLLLVRLVAITEEGEQQTILGYVSDRFIVRAGNPKQFEDPEPEIGWQNEDGMMSTHNKVSIGTREDYGGRLNVNGNIVVTGNVKQFSDRRLKENVVDLDKKEAMERLNKLRIVEYNYKENVAKAMGMNEQSKQRYGIIAQELAEVHPKSVNKEGEFLTVDENRMFYDNIAAVQELSKMHENLEVKIDGRVAHMQAFFGKIFRRKDTKTDGISVISVDSGLAGQKSLSTSRYSLASTFKREIARHSKHEPCSNPRCRKSHKSSDCASKITQGALVMLVAVMAICLLSMSALYVLDWHHRNYGFHSIPTMSNLSNVEDGESSPGLMKKTIHMPRHQPGAPPLHDMCLHAGCRSYCCDNKATYATELRMGGFDIDSIVPLSGSKRAFLAAIAGAEKITPTAFFPKPLFSRTRFEVEGMNMTIDLRYCTERSCNEKKGRYHLFVPVSPYMPTTPIHLKITPPPGMFVQSCGHMLDFQEEECAFESGTFQFTLNMPSAIEVDRNIFEVSAGSYKRSGYRFRVGTNTESCFASEERYKSSYEEYNIIFYRTCGEDSDQAQTTIEIENERDFFPGKTIRSNSTSV